MKKEEAKKLADQALTDLQQALEAGRSEALTRYLDTMSRFHHYSFCNCMLIARQAPDATCVAGFRRWLELGRHVRKGEKGIGILAPLVYLALAGLNCFLIRLENCSGSMLRLLLTWILICTYPCVAPAGAMGLVRCHDGDGHVAVESLFKGKCVSHASPSSINTLVAGYPKSLLDCGPCVDVPLVMEQSVGSADELKQSSVKSPPNNADGVVCLAPALYRQPRVPSIVQRYRVPGLSLDLSRLSTVILLI